MKNGIPKTTPERIDPNGLHRDAGRVRFLEPRGHWRFLSWHYTAARPRRGGCLGLLRLLSLLLTVVERSTRCGRQAERWARRCGDGRFVFPFCPRLLRISVAELRVRESMGSPPQLRGPTGQIITNLPQKQNIEPL